MKPLLAFPAIVVAVLLLASVPAAPARGAAPAGAPGAVGIPIFAAAPVCPGGGRQDEARCHARVRLDASGRPLATTAPTGYTPSDLQDAYDLLDASASGGFGKTIAVVDAFDDPNVESDLAVYRSQFGLPPCTTANGCFRKIDQRGGTNYPRASRSWALEISLDVEMASAICPNCHILLVEADTNSFANLGAAVNQAVQQGASVVSNSYGSNGEWSGEIDYQDRYYNHPGIAITASSGDTGYGVDFPAASQYVTAVGGTSLSRAGNARGWTETTWSGAGSGCSAYIPKPSWQTDPGCPNRTVADVSADADPGTGVAVYDTFKFQGQSGWFVLGGTSVSAPIIASVYALGTAPTYGELPYSNPTYVTDTTAGNLYDVTAGSNGSCDPSVAYLCTAGPGYDGPTGLGTPSGVSAF